LEVPAGALGVPCVYCRPTTSSRFRPRGSRTCERVNFKHFLQIDSALEAFRRASEAAREQTWTLAFGIVFLLPLVFGLAWLLTQIEITY
jgi:hypothetical protein